MSETSGQRPLNLLSVGYPFFPVHAGSAGGAEQILGILDRALVHANHHSVVIAASGSTVAGDLIIPRGNTARLTQAPRLEAQEAYRSCIEEVLQSRSIDLIHFHGLDFLEYRPPISKVSQLATLHLPIDRYPPGLFACSGLTCNCVSHSQMRTCGSGGALHVICNGIDLESFLFSDTKQEFLLWLGRICPEKGPHIALRIAHRLDLPLILAGPVHSFEAHLSYFTEQVEPLLDSKRRYVGAVGKYQRASLLSNARCLLIPALATETSSLVAMEAACSGTPVIAFKSGALPEIVEDRIAGFLSDSEDQMAEHVTRTAEIKPIDCQRVAERRFSSERMVEEYFSLYASLIV